MINKSSSDDLQKTKEQWIDESSVHYEAKRFHEMLKACEQAIYIDISYSRAHFAKGLALIGLKLYEKATVALKHATQLDPQNANIYLAMANVLFALEHYEDAGTAYRQAIQLDPKKDAITNVV